jgi:hypothetical protein
MDDIVLRIPFDDLLTVIDQLTPEQKRLVQARLASPLPDTTSDDEYYRMENINHRMYERARRYWREQGDPRADLTDEDLNAQFWFFDPEGVPRLKSDPVDPTPPPGSLAALAESAKRLDFHSGEPDIAQRSREILETEFTDHLLRYQQDDDEE